mmetsp:Transcript_14609/g.36965  ORF Transcript_14609/g.36965 Transcript_14609/m.36965 type:complete len:111 (-) Transcript_14609:467-799(-)
MTNCTGLPSAPRNLLILPHAHTAPLKVRPTQLAGPPSHAHTAPLKVLSKNVLEEIGKATRTNGLFHCLPVDLRSARIFVCPTALVVAKHDPTQEGSRSVGVTPATSACRR